MTDHYYYAPEPPSATIEAACDLHAEKRYDDAFKKFQILADDAEPHAEANFYVGRYLIDERIKFDQKKDPNVGISYLEVAAQLGFYDAIQYHAQAKMAGAAALRQQFMDAGKLEDADAILERMKFECLPLFLEGARHGNLRCMKDLADYGAKLGDEESYRQGLEMLNRVLEMSKSNTEKSKVQAHLEKLKQHVNVFEKSL